MREDNVLDNEWPSEVLNPLMGTLHRRATDRYTPIRWLVHCPLMGGLLLWYS